MKLDAKTIVALTGLVSVLLGGAEMRIQVGLMASRLDRIEAELHREGLASYDPGQPK